MAIEIKENEILANHSTFKIGGPARYFTTVKNKEEIIEALNFAKDKNLSYFVIGCGSNILFNDKGFDGLIIKIQISSFKIQNSIITAGSGFLLSQLLNFCIQNNLSGLEWAVGIPGTIGGAIADNCGAYLKSISESVLNVLVLDKNGNTKNYNREECKFIYRGSRFKSLDNKEIILEAEFSFEKSDRDVKEKVKNILEQRKGKIPSLSSVGCIFKNDKEKAVIAGKLIEQCGLAGHTIGHAQISELHTNIIVNLGGATSKDVLELISLCKQKVREKFNVELEEEVVIML